MRCQHRYRWIIEAIAFSVHGTVEYILLDGHLREWPIFHYSCMLWRNFCYYHYFNAMNNLKGYISILKILFKFSKVVHGPFRWHGGNESACQRRRWKRPRFDPLVGKIPWRRKWQPTPVFLAEASQGRGSLVGCHLWGRTESDTTEVT